MHPDYYDVGKITDCLAEECSEVIKVCMKVNRFDWDKKKVQEMHSELYDLDYRIREMKILLGGLEETLDD
jgi:Cu/Ag efflux protein CusF